MTPTATQPRYIPPDLEDTQKFSKLKLICIKPENAAKVKESWERLLKAIDEKVDEIKANKETYLPVVQWQDIKCNDGKLPKDLEARFLETGCLIVRNVIDEETAKYYLKTMSDFVTNHPEISGYPDPVTNWFGFWTEGQVKARSHPEMVELMKFISQYFYVEDDSLPIDKTSQVVYPDAFRIRPPGQSTSLNLHLDSGSIERWEDDIYRKMYEPILEGRWEEWDPWRLDERAFAKTDLYSHLETRPTATSAFRAMQGWLALSHTKSGEGTIRMLPNIKLVNAYSILRPFFWRDDGEIDLETPKFPGAIVGSGQFFCDKDSHPHLRQLESVCSFSYVKPGDFVFWHADVAHEVDKLHHGTTDSCVFFNAYTPLCPYNLDNMLGTRQSFTKATRPRDFLKQMSPGDAVEGDFDDHGARKENILTEDGLMAMGFKHFDINTPGLTKGQKLARKMANEAMDSDVVPEYEYSK